jgi:hypothetical protein
MADERKVKGEMYSEQRLQLYLASLEPNRYDANELGCGSYQLL